MFKKISYASILLSAHIISAMAPINIFKPTDKFLLPTRWPGTLFQATVAYENAFRIRGFQADDDDLRTFTERQSNILQIYQCKQNGIAMLKGFAPNCPTGQIAQSFATTDDDGTQGLFIPTGHFKIPVNLMFGLRTHITPTFTFGLFLPYYVMELSRVKWTPDNTDIVNQMSVDQFLTLARTQGCLDLGGWRRQGIGDLRAQFSWMADFPQMRPLLRNVRPQIRLGVLFPTGKKQDEDKMLAFSFGTDGAWGAQIGGGLDLTFGNYFRGGLDAEFIYLFGNTRERRIKTDLAQTDLLFLTKLPAFKEFGLYQQFNLYIESYAFVPGFTFKIDYQHLKHNDDRLFVCSDRIDTLVVNSAESLQEWTTNSFIFALNYDPCGPYYTSWFKPYISLWYKLGLNGKRAFVADTAGIALSLSW
jgi:hypothetical protein